jgi:hypothetical protein
MATATGAVRRHRLLCTTGGTARRHEVDLVIQLVDGRVIGVEIKADSAPGPEAARQLFWLEQSIGDRFAAGVVFHTGPRRITYAQNIIGLPISALWESA